MYSTAYAPSLGIPIPKVEPLCRVIYSILDLFSIFCKFSLLYQINILFLPQNLNKLLFMGFLKEFKEFAVKGNVVDLAIGVIIGAAFGAIVSSLVADVITPLLLTPALKLLRWISSTPLSGMA